MRQMDATGLKTFGETLSQHICTEERELLEVCQRQMPADEMARTDAAMDVYFAKSGMAGTSCALPTPSKNQLSG